MPNKEKKVQPISKIGNDAKPIVRRSAKKKVKNKFDVTIHLFGKRFKASM